jgi:hypothetical protein
MDVIGICYLQYWLQGDAKDKYLNQHLKFIKAHYCLEKLLELIKTLKASSPFVETKICPTIHLQVLLTCSLVFLRSICNLMLLLWRQHFM